jgi:hypothetical protein
MSSDNDMVLMRAVMLTALLLFALAPHLHADERIRVLSYNVENFFDTKDDSLTSDNDFTPNGNQYWNGVKYKAKTINIARVITAAGGWDGAAIVGLYEIENSYVLNSLVKYSPLKKRGYKFVHYDSPDPRGIDVAMLYDPQRIKVLESRKMSVLCNKKPLNTRDVLYVKALLLGADTLHLFMVHTPSRRGGVKESEWRRECVMSMVRSRVDSIMAKAPANILIMGDFNDYPDCSSMCKVLGAKKTDGTIKEKGLYNMFWKHAMEGKGSYKYQGEWNMLDQIIVSGKMLKGGGLYTSQDKAVIFETPFILEEDKQHFGYKPMRTFNGRRYIGGYSDHLPIYIDLFLNREK